jgi:hypothetical protein
MMKKKHRRGILRHAQRRAQERYFIDVPEHVLRDMEGLIRRRECCSFERQTTSRSLVIFVYNKKTYKVIYSRKFGCIVTFLPYDPNSPDEDNNGRIRIEVTKDTLKLILDRKIDDVQLLDDINKAQSMLQLKKNTFIKEFPKLSALQDLISQSFTEEYNEEIKKDTLPQESNHKE